MKPQEALQLPIPDPVDPLNPDGSHAIDMKTMTMRKPGFDAHLLAPWKKSYDQPRQHIKKQRLYFVDTGLSSQSYCFFQWSCMDVTVGPHRRLSTEELMLLNCGDGGDSWESLDCKEIKPVNSKRNQPWIFTGSIDAEAETPIHWPPDAKGLLTGKDPEDGKDWGQEEKRATLDAMFGLHHGLNGHEFQQTPGDDEGQGSMQSTASQRVRHNRVPEQQQI